MLTRTKALLGGVLALAVGFTVLASAVADDPAAVISQRRDLMKDQGKNAKAIYQFTQGQGTAADVAAAAQAIAADATKIPDLFPKGTSLDEFPGKTGAKPAIWQDWDKFKADAAGRVVFSSFGPDEGADVVWIEVPLDLTADGPTAVIASAAGDFKGAWAAKMQAASPRFRFEVEGATTVVMSDPKKGRLVFHKE